MNFLEALRSGKPYRRQSKPPLAHRSVSFTCRIQVFKCWYDAGSGPSCYYEGFSREDVLADDWEIDETGAGHQQRID